jgi:hypothetical protein
MPPLLLLPVPPPPPAVVAAVGVVGVGLGLLLLLLLLPSVMEGFEEDEEEEAGKLQSYTCVLLWLCVVGRSGQKYGERTRQITPLAVP